MPHAGRIIDPAGKRDSLRVLEEVGISPPSYATVKRRLPVFATDARQERLAVLCARTPGSGRLAGALRRATLYFETDTGDGLGDRGSPGTPQITIGLTLKALWRPTA